MIFSQENGIVPLCEVGATATGNVELESFNMAGYDHATILIHLASTYAAVSAAVLTVETASSDSGDSADATFQYRLNAVSATGVASADTYASVATASTLTLTAATYAGHVLLLEIDSGDLPTASKTYQWVTVDLGENASAGTMAAYAILSNPRYAKEIMTTAI